ncbi:MAG: homogentisate 1,2-dioxygenase, partial [Myxococcota bacterium]
MHWMKGKVTRQAHVDIPEGCVEEEFGRAGFNGRYAHLYRTEAPVGWSRIEGDLKPRAYRTDALPGLGRGDYLQSRVPFLANADVTLAMARLSAEMPYWFRNADGDDVLFVHGGAGTLFTTFGPLAYASGDYLVIPRGTTYRLAPSSPTQLLVIETAGEVDLPEKGLLGQHALFDPAMIDVPEPTPAPTAWQQRAASPTPEWEVRIKRQGRLTSLFYPFDPVNTVGWKGNLCAWKI